jgi:hypothetical protein
MQYFYTVDLLLRSLQKFVSSFLEQHFSSYDFWKYFHNFWKRFSFKSENPPGSNCYAHPVPSPPDQHRETNKRALGSRGPHPSTSPSRDGADRCDLADGEVFGQAKMTDVIPTLA